MFLAEKDKGKARGCGLFGSAHLGVVQPMFLVLLPDVEDCNDKIAVAATSALRLQHTGNLDFAVGPSKPVVDVLLLLAIFFVTLKNGNLLNPDACPFGNLYLFKCCYDRRPSPLAATSNEYADKQGDEYRFPCFHEDSFSCV